ncbi:helix-turn-helix domain-containing protein [Gramella jeungdoensis]|uniref:Helix-turn-helix domain-containing protein n=1 Tax=Gramella jeungdoensis TaxID=708091 RepID=A0ABT0Z4F6_9FLAO|nr:helix-turn-helix transcriptional regulator [Gramella jeungdoensis]MCM8570295.1 helix-turn-helix domain-containing protein [Gramella jeungdoensis]
MVNLVVDRAAMHSRKHKEDFLKHFGVNFGKIRHRKKLSFRSLSHKCDLDYADLNKIEKGKRNITLSTIIELAKGLEIHPKELFDFTFPIQEVEK